MAILASIQAFLKGMKYLPIILCVVLVAILLFSIKSCSDEKQARIELERYNNANVRHINDAHQEEVRIITSKAAQKEALQEEKIKHVVDSLNIARKNINYWKHIALSKTSYVTLTEYDTVYEFIELMQIPPSFSRKMDDCLTIEGEFTEKGLKLKADHTLDIVDINYTKRRRLWNIKWFPRIGKKEHFQTLITTCGETITENKKLTFQK